MGVRMGLDNVCPSQLWKRLADSIQLLQLLPQLVMLLIVDDAAANNELMK